MINRYQGNSGRYTRVHEQSPNKPEPPHNRQHSGKADADRDKGRAPVPRPPQSGQSQSAGILEKLGRLLPAGSSKIAQLESEDIILLLILYLMYKESGDSELLMIMGAMFLM